MIYGGLLIMVTVCFLIAKAAHLNLI